MSILYLLIGCSVFLALIFLGAFFWSQKSGQNDDLYTPSMRILLDDEGDENEVMPLVPKNVEKSIKK